MPYVPIIDISRNPDAVGAELDEVCRTIGFFQITGHGLEDGVADHAWTAATSFFNLPLDDKLTVVRPDDGYPYGYIPVAGESLSRSVAGNAPPDLKEVFNIGPVNAPDHGMTDPDEQSRNDETLQRRFAELQSKYQFALEEIETLQRDSEDRKSVV